MGITKPTETKHTPDEGWVVTRVWQEATSRFWTAEVGIRTETRHAHVCTVDGGHRTPEAEAEVKRRARLIAAAPELLDALESLVSVFEQHGDQTPRRRATLDAARAAIAKARE